MALNELPNGKASDPDGLPAEFYRAFWQDTKGDVMDFINTFFRNGADIKLVNRATITLIPKK